MVIVTDSWDFEFLDRHSRAVKINGWNGDEYAFRCVVHRSKDVRSFIRNPAVASEYSAFLGIPLQSNQDRCVIQDGDVVVVKAVGPWWTMRFGTAIIDHKRLRVTDKVIADYLKEFFTRKHCAQRQSPIWSAIRSAGRLRYKRRGRLQEYQIPIDKYFNGSG